MVIIIAILPILNSETDNLLLIRSIVTLLIDLIGFILTNLINIPENYWIS